MEKEWCSPRILLTNRRYSRSSAILVQVGNTRSSLVQGLQSQELESWGKMATIYGPYIQLKCSRWITDASTCEDIAQDVLIKVLASAPEFERKKRLGSFRTWISTITNNACVDWLRRNQFQSATDPSLLDNLEAAIEMPEEDSPSEKEVLLQGAMSVLQRSSQAKTWAIFVDGIYSKETDEAVAYRHNTTAGNVRAIRCRMLVRLRNLTVANELPPNESEE